jgi:hypothetical protein
VDDSSSFRRTGPSEPSSEQRRVIHLRQAGAVRASALVDEVQPDRPARGAELSAGDLFTILWSALADVVGTAAAATLLRRAAQRALPHWPELVGLAITRERLEYRYSLPLSWRDPSAAPPRALCELARELCALLVDLTGPVIVNRLAQIHELRSRGVIVQIQAEA